MATYCLPSTEKVIGPAPTPLPTFISHSGLPVLASSAWNMPLMSPKNTRLPAVVIVPPFQGNGRSIVQAGFCVAGSSASN